MAGATGDKYPSGKLWKPSLRAEDRADFEDLANGLGVDFRDRRNKPMTPGDWLEAKDDPDYVLVGLDQAQHFRVETIWIGLHIPAFPEWDHAIFGTQIVDLSQDGPGPPPLVQGQLNILTIHDPVDGALVKRFRWRNLADAGSGHHRYRDAARSAAIAVGKNPF